MFKPETAKGAAGIRVAFKRLIVSAILRIKTSFPVNDRNGVDCSQRSCEIKVAALHKIAWVVEVAGRAKMWAARSVLANAVALFENLVERRGVIRL